VRRWEATRLASLECSCVFKMVTRPLDGSLDVHLKFPLSLLSFMFVQSYQIVNQCIVMKTKLLTSV
jgi:hypothetical protein